MYKRQTLGTLRLAGNTSGYVQIQPAAAAGSWNMTLPSSGGTNNYVLKTDGSGVTTWVDAVTLVGGASVWQRTLGSLAPTNITDDVNIGAIATGSAMVHLPGITNQNAFFNLGTGNFGIGTTNPSLGKLQVVGGNIIVDAGYGVDAGSAGILNLGQTTAATVNIGGSAATAINMGQMEH